MEREPDKADRNRYQTVYAKEEGAIAAPTAGLHFTPEMLANIDHLVRDREITACTGETDIFLYPPYEFKAINALQTNFHLPCSTLMMLVSAFASRELIMEAYAKAVEEKYRFYSYGDCMLIL